MIFYYIMVFLMPFHNHPLLSASIFGLTTIKIAGGLALIAALIKLSGNNAKFMASKQIVLPYIFFATFFLISATLNNVPITTRYGLRFTTASILFFTTSIMLDNKKSFFVVCLLTIISMDIAGLYAVKQYAAGNSRPGATFGDSNYYAIAASFTAALSMVLSTSNVLRYRLFYIGSAFFLFATLILSGSRGGFLAFMISVIFFIIRSQKKILLFSIMTSVIVIGILFIPNNMVDRFQNKDIGAKKSTIHRLQIIAAGIDMFKKNPFFGIGPGMFKETTSHYFESDDRSRIAHNSYLEVAAELGSFGFISMMYLWYATLRELIKNHKAYPDDSTAHKKHIESIIIALIGYLGGAFFLSVEFEKVIWLSISLAAVSRKIPQFESNVRYS